MSRTGVLQGSILSPYLYSVYINVLPQLLRTQKITHEMNSVALAAQINCLLYADDVVLIAAQHKMEELWRKCEIHSLQIGYRWHLSRCVVLVPFRPGGYLSPQDLANSSIPRALATMSALNAIGVNTSGFSMKVTESS
ncbi:hypothetical protein EC973_006239, partial [Apophysomyces ossiformis]